MWQEGETFIWNMPGGTKNHKKSLRRKAVEIYTHAVNKARVLQILLGSS